MGVRIRGLVLMSGVMVKLSLVCVCVCVLGLEIRGGVDGGGGRGLMFQILQQGGSMCGGTGCLPPPPMLSWCFVPFSRCSLGWAPSQRARREPAQRNQTLITVLQQPSLVLLPTSESRSGVKGKSASNRGRFICFTP